MCRDRVLTLVLAALVASGAGAPVAFGDVCDAIPSIPMGPNPAKGACKLAKGVVHAAPTAISHPGHAAASLLTAPLNAAGDSVMQGVTAWVGKGAAWLVGQAGRLIDRSTTPRLQSAWFVRQYASMATLAALFALPLLLASVLQAITRRDAGLLIRAAFVQLPLAFLLTAMAVTVTALFLRLTDAMCAQVAGSVGNDAHAFFADVGHALGTLLAPAAGTGAAPLFAVFLAGLIAAVGAFFVWVELLIRSAAIDVAVLFLPFTFVAMIWPATARWSRRLLELLFAIVFAKFVIVAILSLAAAGLAHSRSADAFQGVLAGAALMALAALSPMVLLRLVPLAESAAHAGTRSGAGALALGPVAGPAAVMRRVSDTNWGVGAGGLRAAGIGAGGAVAVTGAAALASGAPARAVAALAPATASATAASPGSGDDPRPQATTAAAAPHPAPAAGAARPTAAPPPTTTTATATTTTSAPGPAPPRPRPRPDDDLPPGDDGR
jgi:hypothetical protein